MTHDSSDTGTIVHLPECPAPLCDWGLPDGECMGYEDCHHLCCCGALRACEQRVRQEIDREAFVLDEGDPFRQAYRRGLDAAREAAAGMYLVEPDPAWDTPVSACVDAIDALRDTPTRINMEDPL